MSNKYETGKYHLHLFDKHGTKVDTSLWPNLFQAEYVGEWETQYPPHASYVVTRVIINSSDRAYPWSVSEEDIVHIE